MEAGKTVLSAGNRPARLDPLPAGGETTRPRLSLPPGSHSYVMARLRARGGPAGWAKTVDAYVRREGAPTVVGLEREE